MLEHESAGRPQSAARPRPPLPVRLVRVAVVLALAGTAYAWILPPRALTPPSPPWHPAMGGARAHGVMHVHTQRSDGSGTIDDIARAAGQAGLDFVIFSDHGDGTRAPEPPAYRSGVLCIDAVEISTNDGHVLALGLAQTPFPLAGDASDVVDDIHRFGGLALATHPDSAKPALAWKDWRIPIDGFEWLNGDSEWRDESRTALVRTLLTFPVRGPESIAALFRRPSATLDRWDRESSNGRSLIAVAGADAHARLGWQDTGDDDPDAWHASVEMPSYSTVFRTLSIAVDLETPLAGVADEDAARVLRAIGSGRVHSRIDAYARGGALEFVGRTKQRMVVQEGARVAPGEVDQFTASVRAPAGAAVRLLRNGMPVAETTGVSLEWKPAGQDAPRGSERAVAFRVEVRLARDGANEAAPWMLSNPIWVDPNRPDSGPSNGKLRNEGADHPNAEEVLLPVGKDAAGQWHIERDKESTGILAWEGSGTRLRVDYVLGRGEGSRWVAAALPLNDTIRAHLDDARELSVRMRADAPMRVSLQLRAPSDSQDLRWVRSVFVAGDARTAHVPLESLAPVGPAATRLPRHSVDTLLVVIDRTNTSPGRGGRLWIERVAMR